MFERGSNHTLYRYSLEVRAEDDGAKVGLLRVALASRLVGDDTAWGEEVRGRDAAEAKAEAEAVAILTRWA